MRRVIRLLMIAAAVAASLIAYARLPERVPVHWNVFGEVDRYGGPLEVTVVLPLLMVALWGLFRLLPRIDPLRENYAKFAGTYEVIIDAILAMMLVVHAVLLMSSAGAPISVDVVIRLAVGLLFIVLGNVMPRTRQNWFVGVRTPWTLASARVWERTHRVAGYLFVLLGLFIIATIPLSAVSVWALGPAAGIVAIASVVYSYAEWRKEKAETRTV